MRYVKRRQRSVDARANVRVVKEVTRVVGIEWTEQQRQEVDSVPQEQGNRSSGTDLPPTLENLMARLVIR